VFKPLSVPSLVSHTELAIPHNQFVDGSLASDVVQHQKYGVECIFVGSQIFVEVVIIFSETSIGDSYV
jgi:hypothetical protein